MRRKAGVLAMRLLQKVRVLDYFLSILERRENGAEHEWMDKQVDWTGWIDGCMEISIRPN